jgi:hypothetical protein
MSNDPGSLKDVAQAAFSQHGWIVAAATTTWAVILRALIGMHLAERKAVKTRLANIEEILSRQDERLKNIESRSTFRRREDQKKLLKDDEESDS